MKIATAQQMREIDKAAVEIYGIPGMVLMENAGLAVVYCLQNIFEDLQDKKVYIFCGGGNNGGDGFVIARHLYNKGAKVKVFLVGDKSGITGDARSNLDIISRMDIELIEVQDEHDWTKIRVATVFADCLVDSLLGTGFHGEIAGRMATAIDIINHSGKKIVAVDLPSGIEADTGGAAKVAVKADHTVTFALLKPGLLLYPGAEHSGRIEIADIGIPSPLITSENIRQNLITEEDVRKVLPDRPADAHKGTSGRVTVIAGSTGFTGAAALCSLGALRGGAGLVTLGIAASLNSIMEVKLTEVMTKPLPDIAEGAIGIDALPVIEQLLQGCNVLAIGPGLGRQEETAETVRELVRSADCPMVIDADGLNALSGFTNLLKNTKALAVLTPHPGEMSRLTGLGIEMIHQDKIKVARQFAQQWESIVVLKGAPTIVAFPDGEIFINRTGNQGLATGGTGDILAGLIAAFIAQGLSSHEAALAGVYLHGLAGDMSAGSGMIGMTAGDVLSYIPKAIFSMKRP